MVPGWLHTLAIAALVLGFACALVVAADEARHPQRMWIMNAVWPVVALSGTLPVVWAYFHYGRRATKEAAAREDVPQTPFPAMVAKGTLHCGAGCTLGDVIAEWFAFGVPAVAVWLGWGSIFGEKMFAVWILDFVVAFVLGVAFQYFTIVPMRGLGPLEGVRQATAADALSLTAWQVGMYGFMAIASFAIFRDGLGVKLRVDTPEFWFMMQIAMICGFATSYPVNWWLLKRGIKERM